MPDTPPEQLPARCALDKKTLTNIETQVNKISDQLDGLTDMAGPIAAIDKRVESVEGAVGRAHERIDTVEQKQQDDHDSINRWIGKAVGVTGVVVLIVGAVLKYVLP